MMPKDLIRAANGDVRTVLSLSNGHDHQERNQQSLGNELIEPISTPQASGPIACRRRLGWLLKFCHSDAAA